MDELRKKILIADDNEINRLLLCDMLDDQFDLLEAADGVEAIEVLQEKSAEIRLVLLDLSMPRLDGFGVLKAMKENSWLDNIQVIIISAETDPSHMHRAYDLGAVDYISRPFDEIIVRRRIVSTIMLYAKQEQLEAMVKQQVEEQEKSNNMMIAILSHIMEVRNGESGKHVQNISTITRILLEKILEKTDRYPFLREDADIICLAASLHDIGKIGIPSKILNKPGRLTDEEFTVIKTHPVIGGTMMEDLPLYQDEALVKYCRQICRWHHERWDGRGYPDGLSGDDIPIAAQLVSLADVYDALTSERCYKPPYTPEQAMEMIQNNECGVFQPLLLECLAESAERLRTELL